MVTCNGKESWLLQTLSQPLSLSSEPVLESVNSQQTHTVFCLTDKSQRYAVKLIEDINLSMSSREAQFQLQQRLAHTGLAPNPVWLDHENGLWVENWSRHSYDNNHASHSRLAAAMWRIHNTHLNEPIPSLDLEAEWLQYIAIAQLSETDDLVAESYRLAPQLKSHAKQEDRVLCHNDLAMAHIPNDSSGVILDWEYGATGNRFFDLAAAACVNSLNDEQQRLFAYEYAKEADLSPQYVLKMLCFFLPAVNLTNSLWEAARRRLTAKT